MGRALHDHLSLIVALAVLFGALGGVLAVSLAGNDGQLVYALDDPYIHMAVAKHLSRDGQWSATGHGFTSSSSGPLWTLILAAGYLVVGPCDVMPLVLNVLFATGVCVVAHRALLRRGATPLAQTALLVLLVLVTPLVAVVFCGMEHTLHVLLSVAMLFTASSVLVKRAPRRRDTALLVVLAALTVAARYEGLFLVGAVVVLLLARKRPFSALAVAAGGMLPVCIVGVVSVAHGWYFLPTSVLVKANRPDLAHPVAAVLSVARHVVKSVVDYPHTLTVLLLPPLVLWLYRRRRRSFWCDTVVALALLTMTAVVHVLLANMMWFFRYEAYLFAMGVLAIGAAVRDLLTLRKVGVAVACVVIAFGVFADRTVFSTCWTPRATRNIYRQQIQLARFLGESYAGEAVALNDIGAVAFYTDVRIVDLVGLANLDAARRQLDGEYRCFSVPPTPQATEDADKVDAVARSGGARIAAVYDRWFAVPAGWMKVGEWTIPENLVCGDDTVAFYAIDPAAASALGDNLRAFAPKLPHGVVWTLTSGGLTSAR